MAQYIGLQKLAVMGQTELSVDRPVDRQRSKIRPLGLRSTGRSTEPLEQRADSLPVDRPGRPARSTGAFPESRALWTVDRVGRPALQPTVACTSVHVGRPPGRPTSSVGRPSGRPAEARKQNSGIKKLIVLA